MKALIVYYSLEGNTKMIAEELAKKLGADTLQLVPTKAYPTGKVSKFLWGGKSAVMSDKPVLEPYTFDAAKYDAVILGTPIWASRCAPPLRTFLTDNSLLGKKVCAFACAGGTSPGKAFAQIEELAGVKLAAKELFVSPKTGGEADKDGKLGRLVSAAGGEQKIMNNEK